MRKLAVFALVTAGAVACGTILTTKDAPDDVDPDASASEDGGPGSDGAGGDASDARVGRDAEAGIDAGPCADDLPFGPVVELAELTELGDVSSVRIARDGLSAMVAYDAGEPTFADIREGAFPPAMSVYFDRAATPYGEESPTPLIDPLHIYYHRAPVAAGTDVIVSASRGNVDAEFGTGAPLALPVDAGVNVKEPWSVAGKNILYFTAQPGTAGSRDIYRAEKGAGGAWTGGPVANLSSALDEGYPVVSDDELLIFFARNTSGTRDIMYATRGSTGVSWGSALPAEGTNATGHNDQPVWLSPDKCTLVLTSDRTGSLRAYQVSRVR